MNNDKLLVAFRAAAIKVHMGFRHEGPWEECGWIECEDRRRLLLDSDSQAAEVDRLRRGLESIRDCTPDTWACSMAEQTLNGSPFEDALAASKQYDTDEEFDAAAAMRDKCVDAIKSLRATPRGAAYNNAVNDAIRKCESLTLDPLEPEK